MRPDLNIPAGLCQCGCGKTTTLAKVTDRKKGWVKGQPIRYLVGHANRHASNPAVLAKIFWTRVRRGEEAECWPWLGTKTGEGYGCYPVSKRRKGAHRLAYELTFGPIPKGHFVCHHCDNPICCNPAHLFLGSHRDNMHDMVSKGRGRSPKGEEAAWSKLTEEQVREARRLYRKRHPLFGCTALARKYGVAVPTMWEAIHGTKWAHVE